MNNHKGWLWDKRTGSSDIRKKKTHRETTATIKEASMRKQKKTVIPETGAHSSSCSPQKLGEN